MKYRYFFSFQKSGQKAQQPNKGKEEKRSEMYYIASQEDKRHEALQATIRAEARNEVKRAEKLNKASQKCVAI